MEIAVLALAMTIIIIHGDIDLSVASNVGFSAAVLGLSHEAGMPIAAAAVAALVTGTVLGAFNGVLVTGLGLPSLVVTLGTLALFRGMTQVVLGDGAVTGYPAPFLGADTIRVGPVPLPLLVFVLLAVAAWVLMEKSGYGLRARLIGSNGRAAAFSGIRAGRSRLIAFALGGLMAGTAAVLITSRLGSTRSNTALGLELLVITVVVLGGTDIFGGRGTVGGTVVALFSVFAVRESLAINNVNGQVQDAVMGAILILTIAAPTALARLRATSDRRRLIRGSARRDGGDDAAVTHKERTMQ
jgi:rhamnose transport system permease protein